MYDKTYLPSKLSIAGLDNAIREMTEEKELDYDGDLLELSVKLVGRMTFDLKPYASKIMPPGCSSLWLPLLETDKSAGPVCSLIGKCTTKEEFIQKEESRDLLILEVDRSLELLEVPGYSKGYVLFGDHASYGCNLKRELRAEGKQPRAFYPGELSDTALERCVFGDDNKTRYHDNCYSANSTSRVGMSMEYGGWHAVAELHASKANTITGDLKAHDKSVQAVVTGCVSHIRGLNVSGIRDLCDVGPDDERLRIYEYVREVHARSTFYHMLCADGRVFLAKRGEPSGRLLTIEDNVLELTVVSVYIILLWVLKHNPTKLHMVDEEFILRYFVLSFMGDDNAFSFDDIPELGLNGKTFTKEFIRESFLGLGMTWEPDAGEGRLSNKHTFCSSRFEKRGMLWVPVSERPEKVITNLWHYEGKFDWNRQVAKFDSALKCLCWDDKAFAIVERVATSLGIPHKSRTQYQAYYYAATQE